MAIERVIVCDEVDEAEESSEEAECGCEDSDCRDCNPDPPDPEDQNQGEEECTYVDNDIVAAVDATLEMLKSDYLQYKFQWNAGSILEEERDRCIGNLSGRQKEFFEELMGDEDGSSDVEFSECYQPVRRGIEATRRLVTKQRLRDAVGLIDARLNDQRSPYTVYNSDLDGWDHQGEYSSVDQNLLIGTSVKLYESIPGMVEDEYSHETFWVCVKEIDQESGSILGIVEHESHMGSTGRFKVGDEVSFTTGEICDIYTDGIAVRDELYVDWSFTRMKMFVNQVYYHAASLQLNADALDDVVSKLSSLEAKFIRGLGRYITRRVEI